jgi:hypothetical protein
MSAADSYRSKLAECEQRVIRAAVGWVNVNDRGTIRDLHRLTRAQMRLGAAVTGLERIRNKIDKLRLKAGRTTATGGEGSK